MRRYPFNAGDNPHAPPYRAVRPCGRVRASIQPGAR